MSKKQNLFNDDNEDAGDQSKNGLRINRKFAQKFEHQKKREYVDTAKARFGKDYESNHATTKY